MRKEMAGEILKDGGRPWYLGPMLWRRLDNPGIDWARLSGTRRSPVLRGTSLFMEEGVAGRLDYRIRCEADWVNRGAEVLGWVGDRKVSFTIERSSAGRWKMNGSDIPAVEGCADLDLSFSPATNLLAIRRLHLAVGEEGEARAAWLLFPAMELRPLVQVFRRVAPDRYAYRSDNGFSTELKIDALGWVEDYPPLWTRVEA